MNAISNLPQSALEERDALVERLTELIRTATDEELRYIAEADPVAAQYRTRKHEAALRTIIFKRQGRMTEKHADLPGEVLSIIAEDGDEHIDRAFEIATAVLMINALLNDDHDGAMSICWAENAPVYSRVDAAFLEPFLFGFRWLSEHATEWDYMHEPGSVMPVPARQEIVAIVAARTPPQPVEAPEGPG